MTTTTGPTAARSPVFLALPEAPVPSEEDSDVYATKLGGRPVFFARRPTSSDMASPACANCGRPLFLVLQTYCPLEDSPYHRVLWVWGCNRRKCASEPGSWRVLRGHMLDKAYEKRLRQMHRSLGKKKTRENARVEPSHPPKPVGRTAVASETSGKGAPVFGFGGRSFTPGDLWNSAIDVVPVCVSKAEPDCAMEDAAKSTDEEDLDEASDMEEIVGDVSSRLSAVSLEASPSGSTDSPPGPSFPPYYLYLIEECAEPDYVKGYLSDLAQKDAVEMDVNEDAPGREGRKSRKDGDWADEGYEKASFPRGVDKTLRRFMDRLRRHPAQCVRYNAEAQGGSGLPLLYSHADPVGRRVAEGRTAGSVISVCPRCGSRRAFECQLMPNVISVLRASEHAAPDAGAPRAQRRLREGGGSAVEEAFDAIWNADDGMEFGTVLIYTCERDCHIASETADNEIGYFDEVALVQLEQN